MNYAFKREKPTYELDAIPFPAADCTHGSEAVCHCGLRVGKLQMRHGVLCRLDIHGRKHVSAPNQKDARMAERLVAALERTPEDDRPKLEDIISVKVEGPPQ